MKPICTLLKKSLLLGFAIALVAALVPLEYALARKRTNESAEGSTEIFPVASKASVLIKEATTGRIPKSVKPISEKKEAGEKQPAKAASGKSIPKNIPVKASLPTSLTRYSINKTQGEATVDLALLKAAKSKGSRIIVSLATQKAYLLVEETVAISTPVSTGKAGHRTPQREYKIGEKIQKGKVSNRYNSSMPYWMRLGTSPYGMHVGQLPGVAASHGCVRLPAKVAPHFFSAVSVGTPVSIVGKWVPPTKSGKKSSERLIVSQ